MAKRAFVVLVLAFGLASACGQPPPAPAGPAPTSAETANAAPAPIEGAPQGPALDPPPGVVAVAEGPPTDPPGDVSPDPGVWTQDDLMGRVDPRNAPAFDLIPPRLGNRPGLYGRREAVEALVRMAEAAEEDGVRLTVVSAFRSFSDQKRIWDNKWNGTTLVEGGRLPETVPDPAARALKILEFSSMPGTSRHHWGTDFDLNNLSNAWFEQGEGKRVYEWLVANAGAYGFCQTYSVKGADRPEGYSEERWHWSYMPLSGPMLSAYPRVAGYEQISGFLGAETAQPIDVIAKYVQGINPACLGM